jgi:hypothetical protein
MISALIVVFALAAMGRFAFLYWRALMLGIAAQQLSGRIQAVSAAEAPVAGDFDALLALQRLCPDLGRGGKKIGAVAHYYRALAALKAVASRVAPAVARLLESEMSACARYAAVVVDRRLEQNFLAAAQIRSY